MNCIELKHSNITWFYLFRIQWGGLEGGRIKKWKETLNIIWYYLIYTMFVFSRNSFHSNKVCCLTILCLIPFHVLLEYWAFAQHWLSIVIILLQSPQFTCLLATNSASSLAKLSLNSYISWRMMLLSSVILFWNDRTIGISCLFSILSKASFVYRDMFDIVARWRLGW